MIKGRFNTDADALVRRIHAHNAYGARPLEPWVLEHLDVGEGMRVLEFGCGTGKQTLLLAECVGEHGRVYALDLSADALSALSTTLLEKNVRARVKMIHAPMDEFSDHVDESTFDRILAVYSIYYADAPEQLFDSIVNVMREGAVLFFCGPSLQNNAELKEFHFNLLEGESVAKTQASVFMERHAPDMVRARFTDVQTLTFENPLRFDSEEALCEYWSSYNLYDARIDEKFRRAAKEHFSRHAHFETIKRAIGIRAVKRASSAE